MDLNSILASDPAASRTFTALRQLRETMDRDLAEREFMARRNQVAEQMNYENERLRQGLRHGVGELSMFGITPVDAGPVPRAPAPDPTGLSSRMAALAGAAQPPALPAPDPALLSRLQSQVGGLNANAMLTASDGGRAIASTGPIQGDTNYQNYLAAAGGAARLGMNRPELKAAGANLPAYDRSSYYADKGGAAAYGQQVRQRMQEIAAAKQAQEGAQLAQQQQAQAPMNAMRNLVNVFGQQGAAALLSGMNEAGALGSKTQGEHNLVLDIKKAEARQARFNAIKATNPDLPDEQAWMQASRDVELMFGGQPPVTAATGSFPAAPQPVSLPARIGANLTGAINSLEPAPDSGIGGLLSRINGWFKQFDPSLVRPYPEGH